LLGDFVLAAEGKLEVGMGKPVGTWLDYLRQAAELGPRKTPLSSRR
jgi:hypothetical protein